MCDDLASNTKLFSDDASLFSVVKMTKSVNELNNDLAKINTCAFQWKMSFNPDLTKQAQNSLNPIFNQKLQNINHPYLIFGHNTVSLTESQKNFGIGLDFRLDFKENP